MLATATLSPPRRPPTDLSAQPPLPPEPHRIALVLGSGGVRGAAAIGIADALERHGVRPDLVVGCSSGAYFGALIAMQMDARQALALATTMWTPEVTQQRRWLAWAQLVAPKLTGFNADFALRDNRLIAKRLRAVFGDLRIEQLPTPLRVVATDAATGKRVVLQSGSVADALLASMAVPFLFPSVAWDGRRLVDGVISSPLPVSVANDADVSLALGFEGAMPRRPDCAKRLVAQASTALINNLMRAQLDAARAHGQHIIELSLKLPRRVGLWETRAIPLACEAGREATTECLPRLRQALQVGPTRYAA
jgi:NTE family protein